MITFDGINIESIAPVKIEDIRVGPIEYGPVSRPRAIDGGSEFVRMKDGTRTVSVLFAVQVDNQANRLAALASLSQWAKTDAEHRLEVPSYDGRFLQAVCTSKPEPSLRQWWEAKLRIVFTCYSNPYWNNIDEKSVACGTAFTVLGDAPPLMRIERTLSSAASNQSYGLDGRTMTFSAIPAGDLVIDLNRQTAAVGSSSIMSGYAVASRFLIPRTGLQTITGTGTVKWRERWE